MLVPVHFKGLYMKNVEIIDDALNCTFDFFQFNDDEFSKIFKDGCDVEFIQDVIARLGEGVVEDIMSGVWKRRVDRFNINGAHAILFYGEENYKKKKFFPTKKLGEPNSFFGE